MTSSGGGGAPPPVSMVSEARDWAALPRDLLFDIFLRLGPREVMLGAEFACTAWRRVALDEPALWRHVGMDPWHVQWRYVHMEAAMKLAAVERSAGQCQAYSGSFEDLSDLAGRAPSLKTLDLNYPDEDPIEELTGALKKFPLLEDLQISIPYEFSDDNLLGSVCQACPHLKKLVVRDKYSEEPIGGGITIMMHELRSLELYNCDLSFKGLNDILDNCPVLESLYVHGYFNKRAMDEDLRMKCAGVKHLILPSLARDYNSSSEGYDDSSEDYDDSSEEDSEE